MLCGDNWKIRSSVINLFLTRVEEVCMEKCPEISETDVLKYITSNWMIVFPEGSLDIDFRLGTDEIYGKFGQKVENIDKYVSES